MNNIEYQQRSTDLTCVVLTGSPLYKTIAGTVIQIAQYLSPNVS